MLKIDSVVKMLGVKGATFKYCTAIVSISRPTGEITRSYVEALLDL